MNFSPKKKREAVSRAKELIEKLSLTEKIGQLSQFGTSIYENKTEYYIDHYSEGKIGSYLTVSGAKTTNMLQKECAQKFPTHIPLLFGDDVIHGYRTTMPTPLAQSCSWNPSLVEKGAQAAAKEAYVAGVRWTFSPMVDIARDPRWGRIVEGYGEDPYLCSRFTEAVVRGYQGKGIGEKYRILACLKHFIGYGNCTGGRDYNEAEMSLQTLFDVYLPPFQAGIDAGASTVMSGFHSVNGVPCTGSKYLLTDVLRKKCGFDGFVVSDAGSVDQLIPHGYVENGLEAAYKAFTAGVNMLMAGDLYNNNLPKLIEQRRITEEDIDKALVPIIASKVLLGLFENPYVDEKEEKFFFCDEHIHISRELARESIVLLENDGILPLKKEKKIALIGPLANDKENVLGTWACQKDPSKTVSILEGLKGSGINVVYSKGCDINSGTDSEINDARMVAAESDAAILVLGESFEMSGEAKSRTNLTLPDIQINLLNAVIESGTPVILLISAGRPIVVEDFKKRVAALAYIWQLGTETGNAVADVLIGLYDVSGRLSVSVPRCVGQVPIYYNCPNTGKPYTGKVWYEMCYIDESIYPSYPFGYGLSYTNFEFSNLILSENVMTVNGSINISCKVTNTGNYIGNTVAQLYVRDLVGSCVRPLKELKGFKKISLNPGESCTIHFNLSYDDLAFHNEKLEKVVEPGKFNLWVGQNSNDETLFTQFEINELGIV